MNRRQDCATPTHSPSLTPSCHHSITLVPMSSLPHLSPHSYSLTCLHPHSLTLVPMPSLPHLSPRPHSLTLVPTPSPPHTCPRTLTPSHLSPHPHSLTLNCPSTLTPSHLSPHPHSLTSPTSSLPLSHSLTPSHPHSPPPSSPSLPPSLFPLADGLLKMLYMVLLHQQMRHPGAPKSSSSALTPTPSSSSFLETDIGSITLALQTLGSFNFGG